MNIAIISKIVNRNRENNEQREKFVKTNTKRYDKLIFKCTKALLNSVHQRYTNALVRLD